LLFFCKDVGALKDAQHRHTPTRGATAAQISPLWNGIDRSHSRLALGADRAAGRVVDAATG
jgi:hypothetical protein